MTRADMQVDKGHRGKLDLEAGHLRKAKNKKVGDRAPWGQKANYAVQLPKGRATRKKQRNACAAQSGSLKGAATASSAPLPVRLLPSRAPKFGLVYVQQGPVIEGHSRRAAGATAVQAEWLFH